ncbi:MAG: hypothetical protein JWS10_128 [Cypionkella sp.]|nr:hypothetical protein [Cypionkella sp.]
MPIGPGLLQTGMVIGQKKQVVDQLRKAASAGLVAAKGAIPLRHKLRGASAGVFHGRASIVAYPFGIPHYAKPKLTERFMLCGQERQKFPILQRLLLRIARDPSILHRLSIRTPHCA